VDKQSYRRLTQSYCFGNLAQEEFSMQVVMIS